MRASPLAPAPLARTRGLPASPDAFRRVMPIALRQEHPPAASEEVQTDSVRVRAPQIHFTSPHRTHFMPNHSAKCMMTIAERPGSAQHPADTARAAAMTTSQPPPPVRTTLDRLSAAPRVTEADSPRGEHNASAADNRRSNPPRSRSAQRRRAAVLTPAAAILAAFALLPLASPSVTRKTYHVPKPATFHTHTDHTLLLTPTDYNIYHIYLYTRRLRPATRRLRPAFRLRPPIQLRLANISLQLSNCATRQYQPQKANTQQEHSTTKHTAAHTKRYQATPGTHRIIRSRSKRSLRLSPSAPPFRSHGRTAVAQASATSHVRA